MKTNLELGLEELGYSKSYINQRISLLKEFQKPSNNKKFEGGSVISILTESGIIEDFICEENCDSFIYKGMDGKIYSEKNIINT
jgi:hypothetical protein